MKNFLMPVADEREDAGTTQLWQQYENGRHPNTSARRFIAPRRQLNRLL